MIKFVEMDAAVSVGDQLKEDDGNPVVLINTFTVPPRTRTRCWRLGVGTRR